ncbi:hypothetical protein CDD80_1709 [Ophiocordyceps camponoti-rufipedis]|uniref:CRAL-TRIO domain-containing protein n=1 Tax=Ophiocordyceps camponoti-rufipedis TaxID=2004952 RepID=A0A2C5Z8N0_9HYPO|nr:hypothetical protein CDD80_1709 [Ophiocordyceps camponoti-rufipedis]
MSAIASPPTGLVPEYPRGHVGHLTAEQAEALDSFKALLEERDMWQRGPPASHDDGTLLRFLRARQWVPDKAVEQFASSLSWLTTADVNKLRSTMEVSQWQQSRASVPVWTGRRDKRGQPIYYVDCGAVDEKAWTEKGQTKAVRAFAASKANSEVTASMLTSVLHLEMMEHVFNPMCSRTTDRLHPEVPVTMATYVADIGQLSLRRFWTVKNHVFSLLTSISVLFPETASHIFILNAPSYVGVMWNWVRSWLDPVTASKVVILKAHEVKPALEAYIHPSNIPVRYGGTLDCDFSDGPVLDDSLRAVVEWEPSFEGLPPGPLTVEADGDLLVCYTSGVEDGKPRRQKVFTIPAQVGSSNKSIEVVDEKHAPGCVVVPTASVEA